MKFCKKCHRRIVDAIDNNIQFSHESIRICTCPGRLTWIKKSVVDRALSDIKRVNKEVYR